MADALTDYFACCAGAIRDYPGMTERDYRIGGCRVRLCFAGDSLTPYIHPAIAHLEVPAAETPELKVYLWDGAATEVRLPPPPWRYSDVVQRGEIVGFNGSERCKATFVPGGDALSLVDLQAGEAVYHVPRADQIPYYDWSAPLRNILHFWMSAHRRTMLHAAAVGTSNGGFLIAGKGGSGKSTTALACLGSSLGYLGDDHLLVSLQPEPAAFSLYNSAKLQAEHLRRFPGLLPAVCNRERMDREKALAFLYPDHGRHLVGEFPIRALLVPRVTGERHTRFRPVSRLATLLALAPSTILQLPGAAAAELEALRKLTQAVPGFLLELGTDIDAIPAVLRDKLTELNARGREAVSHA